MARGNRYVKMAPAGGRKDIGLFSGVTLNPKQLLFMQAKQHYVCYGGARGGGKTFSVIVKATMLALVGYPGIRILIMRRKYTQLEENLIGPICKLIPQEVGSYNSSVYTFFFNNGSTIKFGHLNNRNDINDYQGKEYDVIFIDEATQFLEDEFRILGACVRGVNDFPKRIYLTCNPGGIGHQWVKRIFIKRDFKRNLEKPEEDENPDDYLFIPATVYDNAPLMKASPDYVKMLNMMPESMRKAHRDGDWDALSGQFFDEFRASVHTCPSFRIPSGWLRYRAIDYGLDMFACLWIAVDYNGRAYVYREYQMGKDLDGGHGLKVSEAADIMRELTDLDEHIQFTLAPPDVWKISQDTGKLLSDIFFERGVPIVKAENGRVAGWLMLKEYLKPDASGKPMLQIMGCCPQLIENLPMLQVSEKNPNDVDTEPHNITHICDALRYFVASRTLIAIQPEVKPEQDFERDRQESYEEYMTGGDIDRSYIDF